MPETNGYDSFPIDLWKDLPATFRVMQQQQRQQNVIIPETGAGKYWYVDPRATGVSTPASYALALANARFQAQKKTEQEAQREIQSQYQIQQQQAVRAEQQERADIYDRIRYPGMLEPATADNELAEATGTFQIGNEIYILPTQVEGKPLTHEEAIERFKETGEHLGVFESEKHARFYETNYLSP